ncbi:SRPBCC family protein [Humidisolicoccus flavus]|uniref:SRPBCC family protein n=1 Tax=Humidisolicoccus flavus TaxID=3111414 RepID=UPI00324907FB
MSTVTRRVNASIDDVFAVLADGWLYAGWVVGASRMRDVAAEWPNVGATLHHSVGLWPLLINDVTTVIEWDPPKRMVLQAKGWPIGEARIVLEAQPRGDGECVVRIFEEPTDGPGALVPDLLISPAMKMRNREMLQRLAYLAEGRRDPSSSNPN